MTIWDYLLDLLKTISWPITGLVGILLFRKVIIALLERIERAEFLNGKISWKATSADKSMIVGSQEKIPGDVKASSINKGKIAWEKTGDLFWAGRDLMWTIDMLLRGAPHDLIMRGLGQSRFHLCQLGFRGSPLGDDLGEMWADAKIAGSSYWNSPRRNDYANRLTVIIRGIGARAEENQPGYQAEPNN